jgi:hypothetical protein
LAKRCGSPFNSKAVACFEFGTLTAVSVSKRVIDDPALTRHVRTGCEISQKLGFDLARVDFIRRRHSAA